MKPWKLYFIFIFIDKPSDTESSEKNEDLDSGEIQQTWWSVKRYKVCCLKMMLKHLMPLFLTLGQNILISGLFFKSSMKSYC